MSVIVHSQPKLMITARHVQSYPAEYKSAMTTHGDHYVRFSAKILLLVFVRVFQWQEAVHLPLMTRQNHCELSPALTIGLSLRPITCSFDDDMPVWSIFLGFTRSSEAIHRAGGGRKW
jgi:hypothetical protein